MFDVSHPITARTRLLAVLGHPVAHSLSPVMHNPALAALGLDIRYVAFDIAPDSLLDVLAAMSRMGFVGANLTIPLKEIAFKGIECLDDSARRSGSVNTVRFLPGGAMEGHSTDAYGLAESLREELGEHFHGRRVLVLGCGGAGRAAALRAAEDGAAELRLANRGSARAETLAKEIAARFPKQTLACSPVWPPSPDFMHGADLILQSTSLGMKDEADFPFTPDHFRAGQALLDMTYVQQITPFMSLARKAGARATNGLSMLLHQGARSLEIWTGLPPPLELMRKALHQHMYGETV